ncbi:MAG: Xaa-Pro peptidase family protein [Fimbriimonadales bacterium]|nr:Xaa-Pro peptidase family protein [Fimbriimonadales bacterium]
MIPPQPASPFQPSIEMKEHSPLKKLRARMRELGVSASLITYMDNVRWLTGFSGSSGFVIVSESDGVFISDSRYSEQAREEVKDLPVVIYANPTTPAQAIAQEVARLGIKQLAFEAEHVTFSSHALWKKEMPSVEFLPVEQMVDRLRMVKSPEEIGRIREACGIADACFSHVLWMIQPGVREFDLALDIEFFIRRSGARLAFDVIVVSGERTSRPHGFPTEKRLEKGDFVTLDFGAVVGGYCSDLTRTVVVGEASPRQREIYFAVKEAEETAISVMKPGMPAREVDRVAREVLRGYGLDKYFGHGLGHGLGRAVHDVGRMNPTSEDVLAEGQVWTVEPGVYVEGFGGCRIEDDVLITPEGAKVLTHSERDLLEV